MKRAVVMIRILLCWQSGLGRAAQASRASGGSAPLSDVFYRCRLWDRSFYSVRLSLPTKDFRRNRGAQDKSQGQCRNVSEVGRPGFTVPYPLEEAHGVC